MVDFWIINHRSDENKPKFCVQLASFGLYMMFESSTTEDRGFIPIGGALFL
jgi:hypothetical protein